jgi:hypothetical protein
VVFVANAKVRAYCLHGYSSADQDTLVHIGTVREALQSTVFGILTTHDMVESASAWTLANLYNEKSLKPHLIH